MIKLGIIGLGHLGSIHHKIFKSLSSHVSITGLCDIDPLVLNKFKNEDALCVEHFEKLVNTVDAVSICVPTEHHHRVAAFFIDHGIHVFIEKPFTRTLNEADDLLEKTHKNNIILQVGHVERFNAAFQALAGIIKHPKFIECHRLSPFPNRSLDIGVVMDLMIHDIDIISGLVPSEIAHISAVGVNVLTPYEDIANARLTFEDGCVCNLTVSRISEDMMRKIRIFQTDTYINLDYIRQEAYTFKRIRGQIVKKNLPIEKEQPLQKELSHFVHCVKNNQQPLVDGADGRKALAIALEISQSIWKNINQPTATHQPSLSVPIL